MIQEKLRLPKILLRHSVSVDGRLQGGNSVDRMRAVGGRALQVVFSGSGKVDPASGIFRDKPAATVVFTTKRMPQKIRSALAPVCDLHVFEAPAVPLRAALAILRQDYDARSFVCEGGGGLFRALAEEDLIDAIELEILPEISGGTKKPSLSGLPGKFLPKPLDFRMTSMKVEDGCCLAKFRRVSGRAC